MVSWKEFYLATGHELRHVNFYLNASGFKGSVWNNPDYHHKFINKWESWTNLKYSFGWRP